MSDPADRLHRRIFLLTAGFLFTAAVLRSVLSFAGDPYLAEVLLLLFGWAVLFGLEPLATARWRPSFDLYLVAQTAIVVVLLARADSGDFYAVLFGILSMQAMQRLGWKAAVAWIVIFTPLTALPLMLTYGVPQAVAFALIYAAVDGFLAFFTHITRRAAEARAGNELLVGELQVANGEIEAYSRQIERLAAAKERHRLARELHDSVTQTVFGMNLTAQSAALLLPRDRSAAAAQLERLEELTESALAEIGALSSLAPAELERGGLEQALRRHLDERGLPEGLAATLTVAGAETPEPLTAAQELCLFRIAQEALNNVVKHAQASDVVIRLRLSAPCGLEIEDNGHGFDLLERETAGGMGLVSMAERAEEISWSLSVVSSPGAGTRIAVEQTGVEQRAVEQSLAGRGAAQRLEERREE
jgi:signal transduction histidine kinase